MRHFLFGLLIALIAIWTGFIGYRLAQTPNANGLVILTAMFMWALGVVPLGIFALIAKP